MVEFQLFLHNFEKKVLWFSLEDKSHFFGIPNLNMDSEAVIFISSNWEPIVNNPISIIASSIIKEDLFSLLNFVLSKDLKVNWLVFLFCFFKVSKVSKFSMLHFLEKFLIYNKIFVSLLLNRLKRSAVEVFKISDSPWL